jgi:hypothetical protein
MNVELYLAELERSVRNVPVILSRWEEFSPAMRQHLAGELRMMILRQSEARDASLQDGSYWSVATRLGELNSEVVSLYDEALSQVVGVCVRDLIAPTTSSVAVRGRGRIRSDDVPSDAPQMAFAA